MIRLVQTLLFIFTLAAAQAQRNFYDQLADSALTLTYQNVQYDPAYFQIPYPNGDVPSSKGVCTDVVIRAYRKLGIDLTSRARRHAHKFFEVPKTLGPLTT